MESEIDDKLNNFIFFLTFNFSYTEFSSFELN